MIAETYLRTNHHLASRLPSKESIAGKFNAGDNILTTRDPDLHFRMDAKAAGFYETAVFWQPPNQKTRSERTDFVTGSGEKGQTYLYWRGNQLFQLPVSYWMEFHAWVNSPGFIDGTADFERPIVPRCLECHATYFAPVSSATAGNVYRKNGYVLGISCARCQRCHGAGREHVERERACDKGEKSPQRLKPSCDASDNGPTEVVPSQIVPSKLGTRRRCRGSGKWKSVRNATEESGSRFGPAFSYVPGQPLENYIRQQRPDANAAVDVHGNQVAPTQRSRCYQNSQLRCTICHEVHAPERAAAAYSEKPEVPQRKRVRRVCEAGREDSR
jgi:hypothetical protein